MKIELQLIKSEKPLDIERLKFINIDFVPQIGSFYMDAKQGKSYLVKNVYFTDDHQIIVQVHIH